MSDGLKDVAAIAKMQRIEFKAMEIANLTKEKP